MILLFSVIVPTFNRVRLLACALESVFAQTCKDYEIIVIDDGSTDDTHDYLKSLDQRVTYLSQSNHGPGAARNVAAQHAKGDYLAFLDSDDLWFPWTLSCFAKLIEQYERPAILASKLLEFAKESELAIVKESGLRAEVFADYFASHRHNYFVGSGMSVLLRDEFLSSQGFTTELTNFEDHDLILRMGEAKGFVQIVEPVTVGYRRHLQNLTRVPHRSYEGACYLVRQERSGCYPGGRERARARHAIITQRTRPATFGLLRSGLVREAWALYRATLGWNVTLGRWKYLGGFPLKTLTAWMSTVLN